MSQRSVNVANEADEKPWKIIKNSKGEIEGYKCGRLGCYSDKLVPVASPHSALQLLVCPPCRWAENRWDELHRKNTSKLRGIRVGATPERLKG